MSDIIQLLPDSVANQIAVGIEEFRGIGRRFEVLDDWQGAAVVDDYAHHPTALLATLRAAAGAHVS